MAANLLNCPMCGQGGLTYARVIPLGPVYVTICAECDRMWLDKNDTDELDFDTARAVCYSEYMEERGLEPIWEYLEKTK